MFNTKFKVKAGLAYNKQAEVWWRKSKAARIAITDTNDISLKGKYEAKAIFYVLQAERYWKKAETHIRP